jgi:hypothetical protein
VNLENLGNLQKIAVDSANLLKNSEIMKTALGASAMLKERNFNIEATPLGASLKDVKSPAEWTYERLGKLFKDFEDGLDNEHEVGLRLVSFGNTSVYRILDIGFWGPDIIIFHCLDNDGNAADLIQNVAQLNVLLLGLPKLEEKPRRIGFSTAEEK